LVRVKLITHAQQLVSLQYKRTVATQKVITFITINKKHAMAHVLHDGWNS